MSINILYDGSILKNGLFKNTSRSGIYFVALNLFYELLNRKNINVYMYLSEDSKPFLGDLLKSLQNRITADKIIFDDGDFSNINAFLSPVFKIPDIIKSNPHITQYSVVHDVIPLLFPGYFFDRGGWFTQMISGLNSSSYYFSNSKHTAEDFIKYFPQLDKEKIKPIPLSSNFNFKPNKDKTAFGKICEKYHVPTDKKYLFSLCSLEPRKNLVRAVKCFVKFIERNKIEDLVYVLGGGAWVGFMEKFKEEVPEWKQYSDKIIRAGYIDDEDLEPLYSNAEWFVYTSQYEGFGMPPLEAMKCGCPVITSNNSSLPEVVGNAGLTIDWDSDEQHIQAYEKYYFNKALRDKNSKLGLHQAGKFTWEKAVDIIINQMETVEQKKNQNPEIAIITDLDANNEENIEKLIKQIKSLSKQKYQNIKHYILNRSGTDIQNIQKSEFTTILNYPDADKYAAINDIINKIHAKYFTVIAHDDFYSNSLSIMQTIKVMEEKNAPIAYGRLILKNEETSELLKSFDAKYNMYPPFAEQYYEQAFIFNRKEVLNRKGFDKTYPLAEHAATVYQIMNSDNKIAEIATDIICTNEKTELSEAELNNRIEAFYRHYGQHNNLTYLDSRDLFGKNYTNGALDEIIELGSKLKKKDYLKSFFKAVIEEYSGKSKILGGTDKSAVTFSTIKAFNILPLWKGIELDNISRYYLLNTLPVWSIKKQENRNTHYLLQKIPVFSVNLSKKYYNLPHINVGQKIDFSQAVPFPIDGFSHTEEWGIWSEGKTSVLKFATPQKCKVTFDVVPFINNKLKKSEVDVYLNGTYLTTWQFVLNNPLPNTTILLPKSDSNELKFIYHHSKSPKELGIGDDTRKLSLGFCTMKIQPQSTKDIDWQALWQKIYTHDENEYINQIRIMGIVLYRRIKQKLPQRTTIAFNKETPDIKLTGFSDIENWGRWSDGGEATITFFNYKTKRVLLDVQPFLNDKHQEQAVKVYLNGKKIGRWEFKSGQTFIVPTIALKSFRKNCIKFKIVNPISPKELEMGEDARQLGLGIKSMLFTADKQSTTGKFVEYIDNEYIQQLRICGLTMYRCIKKELPKLKTFEFNQENPELKLTGFSGIESWGRWSDGGEATISFFNYDAKSVYFDMQAFLHEKHPKVEVEVYLNGKKQAVWEFKHGKIFVNPVIWLKTFQKNTIKFRILNSISPKELNLSSDSRRLGIGIKKISSMSAKEELFIQSYNKYMKKKFSFKPRLIKRLFITTGNFSLLNSLCYIEETKNEAKYEDYLLIYGATNQQFIDNNLTIAKYGHFKQVIVCDKNNNIEEKLVKNNLSQIDEVIFCWQGACFNAIAKLYPKSKLIVDLESMPFFRITDIFPQKIYVIYMQKYLDKLDYPYKEDSLPIKYMDKEIYQNTLSKIQKGENLVINVKKKDKCVLFCSPNANILKECPANHLPLLLKKIESKGYSILLKKHPRDTTDYSQYGIKLLDTAFPVEFYDLSNVLCVAGYQSTLLITLENEIATFATVPEELENVKDITQRKCSQVSIDYCLPVDVLLRTKLQSFDKMRKHFQNLQKKKVEMSEMLSENIEFLKKFPA